MTSGVYQLTFSNRDNYIGKSINIEERYKQHMNKFYKGTAAKPMQRAFNTYGAPTSEIIRICHEDHIDVVEACFISRNKPTLNSNIPKDPFPDLTTEELDYLFDTFKDSARDIIAKKYLAEIKATENRVALNNSIASLDRDLHKLSEKVVEITDLNNKLLIHRSEEEIQADISKRIIDLEQVVKKYLTRIKEQSDELNKLDAEAHSLFHQLEYERLPWWKKLFK